MSFRATVLATIATITLAGNLHDRAYYEAKFFNWLSEHGLKVENGERFVHMLQNFANNDDLIESHNAGNSTYTLGHNKFSHLSLDEWRAYVRLGLNRPTELEPPANIHQAPVDLTTLATEIDWTTKGGAVSAVKDQGQCGSCWSFSTTGALEGAHFNHYAQAISLSEQHLVDCDTPRNGGSDLGCNGGLMDSAFTWIKKNGGIATEVDYPYFSGTTKSNGACQDATKTKASTLTSYTDVATNSDTALMSALNKQTVSVAIEADQSAFQLYKSGVFTGTCGANLDHGVLAVGYGTLNGVDYYKVKNSWGTSWGSQGYILLARGSSYNKGAGQCGILAGPPSYPNI